MTPSGLLSETRAGAHTSFILVQAYFSQNNVGLNLVTEIRWQHFYIKRRYGWLVAQEHNVAPY